MADKEEQNEPSIAQDLVVTKYKMAAEMVNSTYTFRDSLLDLLYLRIISCYLLLYLSTRTCGLSALMEYTCDYCDHIY